jgi:LacI family transcriptional regulator
VAHGVLLGLIDGGKIPGKDITVLRFDNVSESYLYNPPLTTVSSFALQIGFEAANLLHQRIIGLDRVCKESSLSRNWL